MNRQPFLRTSAIALSLVAATIATPAAAQDAAATPAASEEAEGGIQEIIVTAQKRAENVQDVPIAISAFGGAALTERAVLSVAELSGLAPNVNLDGGTPFSGSASVLSATIRGIGSDDFAFNIDPGVGIYLDGVYLARTVGANQDLPDVERIEVLKGPQGTLFGRNTIGGAISIVTHTPGDKFTVAGDLTTGSYGLVRARGTIDIPLADSLSSSVTFSTTNRKGFLKRIAFNDQRALNSDPYRSFTNAGFGSGSREGGDNSVSLRGKLKWDNGGRLTATFTGDYTRQDSTAQATKLVVANPNIPGNFAGTANLPGTAFDPTGTTGFLFAGLYNFCIGSTTAQIAARNAQALCGARGTQFLPGRILSPLASVNVDADPTNDRIPFDTRFLLSDPDRSYATGPSFAKINAFGLAGTIDYEISDNLDLKSITAYRESGFKSGSDLDGSPLSILELSFDQNQEQFSQELQLLGQALDKKLNFVLGAYYFKEKGDLHDYVTFAEGLLQVDGPNSFNTRNYAFFGQIDYRPVDLVSFTIGGRYTKERKLFEGGQQDLNGFNYKLFGCANPNGTILPFGDFPLAPPQAAGGPPCFAALSFPDPTNPTRLYVPGVNRKSFSNFSPKAGIQLHPSDDLLIYGSWSKGYKTGGYTTRLSNPQGNFAPDFNEEKATTYEVGVKSTLLDRKLQINAAAFTTAYRDLQLNIQIGTSPTIDNAGSARIKGFEVEVTAAPTTGLTLTGSLGYVDAKFTRLDPAALVNASPIPGIQAGIFVGAPLPKTPKLKTNFSPRYEAKFGNGGALILLADWTHSSKVENDIARTLATRRQSYDLVNASITYEDPSDNWTLTVGGTNLTDDRFFTSGGANLAAGGIFGTYNRPREWYARLGFKF